MEKLRILIVEDSPADIDLIERELQRGGVDFVSCNVKKRADFLSALDSFKPDIILSDHSLPQFNSIEAMELWKEYQREHNTSIPFILVTGSVSEEFAVQSIKAGADDYILKDRLKRLPASVMSAVEKARIESERHRGMEERLAQAALMNEAEHLAHFGSWRWDLVEDVVKWSDEAYRIFGFEPGEVVPTIAVLMPKIHPDDRAVVEYFYKKAIKTGDMQQCEYRLIDGNREKVLLTRILVKRDAAGVATELVGFTLDITTHRQQTRELEARNARLMEIAWVQSHEVRGPLARLMGLVQLLGHNPEDLATMREMLPHILNSAVELDNIVRKIVRKTEEIS
jgi:CheY-like chemotaxis protein